MQLPGVSQTNSGAGASKHTVTLVNTSQLVAYLIVAEPIIYLYGFSRTEQGERPPALLRGSLIVRVLKPTKIRNISLSFKGTCRTEWPEGIPPKKIETYETNEVYGYTWRFFDALSKSGETSADAQVVRNLDDSVQLAGPPLSLTRSRSTYSRDRPLSMVFDTRSILGKKRSSSPPPPRSVRSSQSFSMLRAASGSNSTSGGANNKEESNNSKGYRQFQPAEYIYSFELTLPQTLPETAECNFGQVKYFFDLQIDRQGTFKAPLSGQHEMKILRSLALSNLEASEPIAISRDWEDLLHYEITIIGKAFPINGVIPITFALVPLAQVKCHRIRVYVTEHTEYFCKNRKVHRVEPAHKFLLLEKLPEDGIRGSLLETTPDDMMSLTELNFNIKIPSTFPNRRDNLRPNLDIDNIKVHHWVKVVMRLSRSDINEMEKPKLYEVSIDSPITLVDERTIGANTLPAYGQDDNIRADPSETLSLLPYQEYLAHRPRQKLFPVRADHEQSRAAPPPMYEALYEKSSSAQNSEESVSEDATLGTADPLPLPIVTPETVAAALQCNLGSRARSFNISGKERRTISKPPPPPPPSSHPLRFLPEDVPLSQYHDIQRNGSLLSVRRQSDTVDATSDSVRVSVASVSAAMVSPVLNQEGEYQAPISTTSRSTSQTSTELIPRGEAQILPLSTGSKPGDHLPPEFNAPFINSSAEFGHSGEPPYVPESNNSLPITPPPVSASPPLVSASQARVINGESQNISNAIPSLSKIKIPPADLASNISSPVRQGSFSSPSDAASMQNILLAPQQSSRRTSETSRDGNTMPRSPNQNRGNFPVLDEQTRRLASRIAPVSPSATSDSSARRQTVAASGPMILSSRREEHPIRTSSSLTGPAFDLNKTKDRSRRDNGHCAATCHPLETSPMQTQAHGGRSASATAAIPAKKEPTISRSRSFRNLSLRSRRSKAQLKEQERPAEIEPSTSQTPSSKKSLMRRLSISGPLLGPSKAQREKASKLAEEERARREAEAKKKEEGNQHQKEADREKRYRRWSFRPTSLYQRDVPGSEDGDQEPRNSASLAPLSLNESRASGERATSEGHISEGLEGTAGPDRQNSESLEARQFANVEAPGSSTEFQRSRGLLNRIENDESPSSTGEEQLPERQSSCVRDEFRMSSVPSSRRTSSASVAAASAALRAIPASSISQRKIDAAKERRCLSIILKDSPIVVADKSKIHIDARTGKPITRLNSGLSSSHKQSEEARKHGKEGKGSATQPKCRESEPRSNSGRHKFRLSEANTLHMPRTRSISRLVAQGDAKSGPILAPANLTEGHQRGVASQSRTNTNILPDSDNKLNIASRNDVATVEPAQNTCHSSNTPSSSSTHRIEGPSEVENGVTLESRTIELSEPVKPNSVEEDGLDLCSTMDSVASKTNELNLGACNASRIPVDTHLVQPVMLQGQGVVHHEIQLESSTVGNNSNGRSIDGDAVCITNHNSSTGSAKDVVARSNYEVRNHIELSNTIVDDIGPQTETGDGFTNNFGLPAAAENDDTPTSKGSLLGKTLTPKPPHQLEMLDSKETEIPTYAQNSDKHLINDNAVHENPTQHNSTSINIVDTSTFALSKMTHPSHEFTNVGEFAAASSIAGLTQMDVSADLQPSSHCGELQKTERIDPFLKDEKRAVIAVSNSKQEEQSNSEVTVISNRSLTNVSPSEAHVSGTENVGAVDAECLNSNRSGNESLKSSSSTISALSTNTSIGNNRVFRSGSGDSQVSRNTLDNDPDNEENSRMHNCASENFNRQFSDVKNFASDYKETKNASKLSPIFAPQHEKSDHLPIQFKKQYWTPPPIDSGHTLTNSFVPKTISKEASQTPLLSKSRPPLPVAIPLAGESILQKNDISAEDVSTLSHQTSLRVRPPIPIGVPLLDDHFSEIPCSEIIENQCAPSSQQNTTMSPCTGLHEPASEQDLIVAALSEHSESRSTSQDDLTSGTSSFLDVNESGSPLSDTLSCSNTNEPDDATISDKNTGDDAVTLNADPYNSSPHTIRSARRAGSTASKRVVSQIAILHQSQVENSEENGEEVPLKNDQKQEGIFVAKQKSALTSDSTYDMQLDDVQVITRPIDVESSSLSSTDRGSEEQVNYSELQPSHIELYQPMQTRISGEYSQEENSVSSKNCALANSEKIASTSNNPESACRKSVEPSDSLRLDAKVTCDDRPSTPEVESSSLDDLHALTDNFTMATTPAAASSAPELSDRTLAPIKFAEEYEPGRNILAMDPRLTPASSKEATDFRENQSMNRLEFNSEDCSEQDILQSRNYFSGTAPQDDSQEFVDFHESNFNSLLDTIDVRTSIFFPANGQRSNKSSNEVGAINENLIGGQRMDVVNSTPAFENERAESVQNTRNKPLSRNSQVGLDSSALKAKNLIENRSLYQQAPTSLEPTKMASLLQGTMEHQASASFNSKDESELLNNKNTTDTGVSKPSLSESFLSQQPAVPALTSSSFHSSKQSPSVNSSIRLRQESLRDGALDSRVVSRPVSTVGSRTEIIPQVPEFPSSDLNAMNELNAPTFVLPEEVPSTRLNPSNRRASLPVAAIPPWDPNPFGPVEALLDAEPLRLPSFHADIAAQNEPPPYTPFANSLANPFSVNPPRDARLMNRRRPVESDTPHRWSSLLVQSFGDDGGDSSDCSSYHSSGESDEYGEIDQLGFQLTAGPSNSNNNSLEGPVFSTNPFLTSENLPQRPMGAIGIRRLRNMSIPAFPMGLSPASCHGPLPRSVSYHGNNLHNELHSSRTVAEPFPQTNLTRSYSTSRVCAARDNDQSARRRSFVSGELMNSRGFVSRPTRISDSFV